MRNILITVFAALAALLGLSAPAWANPTPGGSGTISVTGAVALSCGFTSSNLGTLAFGNLTPGGQADASINYTVACNDNSGWSVLATDAGASVVQNGNNVSIPSSAYQVEETSPSSGSYTTPWPSSGATPATIRTSSGSTSGMQITDMWQLSIPSNLFYPGAMTDTITLAAWAT
jgi:hypothetical protein